MSNNKYGSERLGSTAVKAEIVGGSIFGDFGTDASYLHFKKTTSN